MSAADIVVRLAVDTDRSRWNEFLLGREASSPFALFEWRDVLAASYGPVQRLLIAERAGAIVGILPTYVGRSLRGKRTLYSLRQGLNTVDRPTTAALLAAAERIGTDLGCRDRVIAMGPSLTNVEGTLDLRKTVVLDLADGIDALWKRIGDKARNIIRKGRKSGLVLEWSNEGLADFYNIYAEALSGKSVPILDRRFFDAVFRHIAESARLLVVKDGAMIVGGTVMLSLGRCAVYPFQAVLPAYQKHSANALMTWAAAEHCAARGIATLDMGESSEGSSVYRFKVNFGGRPVDIPYYTSNRAVHTKVDQGMQTRIMSTLRDSVGKTMPRPAKASFFRMLRIYGRII